MNKTIRNLKIHFSIILLGLFFSALLAPAPTRVWAHQQQFYEASIEIDDPRPEEDTNWTIRLKNKQEIPPNGAIMISPQITKFTIPVAMDYEDLDLTIGTEKTLAVAPGSGADAAWGVTVVSGTSGSITLTNNDTDTIVADSSIVIEIGTIASQGALGEERIQNPAKEAPLGTGDVWWVDLVSQDAMAATIDYIELLISTIESVHSYAGPKPHMTFEVTGITPPADGVIDSNIIEWREISPAIPKTAVMRVKVNTDAQDGFIVYVRQDTNMLHDVDPTVDIDPVKNGVVGTNDSPVAWTSPLGTTIGVDTGFLGYTTSDATLNTTGDGVNRFTDGTLYAGLTTSGEEVLYHPEASHSNVEGQDYADVTFQLEINSLQPTGNYSNEIMFIVKPIF